jgi:hypothetical protein
MGTKFRSITIDDVIDWGRGFPLDLFDEVRWDEMDAEKGNKTLNNDYNCKSFHKKSLRDTLDSTKPKDHPDALVHCPFPLIPFW